MHENVLTASEKVETIKISATIQRILCLKREVVFASFKFEIREWEGLSND